MRSSSPPSCRPGRGELTQRPHRRCMQCGPVRRRWCAHFKDREAEHLSCHGPHAHARLRRLACPAPPAPLPVRRARARLERWPAPRCNRSRRPPGPAAIAAPSVRPPDRYATWSANTSWLNARFRTERLAAQRSVCWQHQNRRFCCTVLQQADGRRPVVPSVTGNEASRVHSAPPVGDQRRVTGARRWRALQCKPYPWLRRKNQRTSISPG